MKKAAGTSKQGARILAQIAKVGPFLPASLVVARKRCGRKDCRCAEEGPVHPTANVTWKEGGKTRTLHVPQELVEEVAQWTAQWTKLGTLIREMGEEQRRHLMRRRKSSRA